MLFRVLRVYSRTVRILSPPSHGHALEQEYSINVEFKERAKAKRTLGVNLIRSERLLLRPMCKIISLALGHGSERASTLVTGC
jgi:hypothetical protein